ncbi:MAG: 4-hydroxythreonine-4-phosphate dehydrogenase [Bacteroidia bacterium]|nr:MAG: 4-hydroxythreonine-4-phosphate dehydrogenase [Bacteroidia bacterium]
MIKNKPIIGISQGDINGIGPEVILKSVYNPDILEICTPVIFSSQKTITYFRKALHLNDFNFHPIKNFSQLNPKKVNVFVCYEEEVPIDLGQPTLESAKYAYISLETAVNALLSKQIHALVTAPINKQSIQKIRQEFRGHTEYIAYKLKEKPLMTFVGEELKIALLTIHTPISSVTKFITQENIIEKINILKNSLIQDFQIRKPKIAVLGLNPHAGENGLIGNEDKEIISPAIQSFENDKSCLVYGPFSSDAFFGKRMYKEFDAVLAMYHDQGLIPFKMLEFETGVNYTAGLSVVRTSPDHGTAYDIAQKFCANHQSMLNSIYLAIDILNNRKLHKEITQNPLKISEKIKEQ